MKAYIFVFAVMAASVANGRELLDGTLRFSAGGVCQAHGNTTIEKSAYDGFAKAVASAYKSGCGTECSGDELVVNLTKEYDTCALALVNIWTSAFSQCTTYGNTFGCASALAYGKAKTQAVIELFSEASAQAKNECKGCDPAAVSEIWSKLAVNLFAQAESKVISKVCVGPNESASAKAFSWCHAKTLAHGLARAHAYAIIQGGCAPGKEQGSKLQADTLTEVDNTIDVDPDCFCTGWLKSCNGVKCDWKKAAPGNEISKVAASKCPVSYAYFKAECAAFASQVA